MHFRNPQSTLVDTLKSLRKFLPAGASELDRRSNMVAIYVGLTYAPHSDGEVSREDLLPGLGTSFKYFDTPGRDRRGLALNGIGEQV